MAVSVLSTVSKRCGFYYRYEENRFCQSIILFKKCWSLFEVNMW